MAEKFHFHSECFLTQNNLDSFKTTFYNKTKQKNSKMFYAPLFHLYSTMYIVSTR